MRTASCASEVAGILDLEESSWILLGVFIRYGLVGGVIRYVRTSILNLPAKLAKE